MRKVTRAQAEACLKLFSRGKTDPYTGESVISPVTRRYRRFRRGFRIHYGGYLGGEWKGMFIGIEPDGHTHS